MISKLRVLQRSWFVHLGVWNWGFRTVPHARVQSRKREAGQSWANQQSACCPLTESHSPLCGYTSFKWLDDGRWWKRMETLHQQRLEHWFFIEPSGRNSARSAEAAMVHLQSLVGCVGNTTIGGWDSCRVGASVWSGVEIPFWARIQWINSKKKNTNFIEFPWQPKVFGKFNPNNTNSW